MIVSIAFRGEEGTKIDLIETAKLIADAAMVVYKLAHEVAAECQERKIKRVTTHLTTDAAFMLNL